MPETVYFLSDAHLGSGPPAVEAAKERDLQEFLIQPGAGDVLYLLGDLFDFWFDFGGPPPARHGPVLRAIGSAVARGAAVWFMGGNHDHWARAGRRPGWLETALGVRLLPDPAVVEHQGLRLLLTHGDALGGARGGYRVVRGVLHHPIAIGAFRQLPRRLGLWLARHTSRASRRRHDATLQAHDAALLRLAALSTLVDGPYDAVVAGHVHAPELLEAPQGLYLNLGDWIEHRTYGRLAGGRLSLDTFRS